MSSIWLTSKNVLPCVGQMGFFLDTIGVITGVSEVAYVHLPLNQNSTAKRFISLKDLSDVEKVGSNVSSGTKQRSGGNNEGRSLKLCAWPSPASSHPEPLMYSFPTPECSFPGSHPVELLASGPTAGVGLQRPAVPPHYLMGIRVWLRKIVFCITMHSLQGSRQASVFLRQSDFQWLPPSVGVQKFVYCSRVTVNIIAQAQNKVMVMFSDDDEELCTAVKVIE